MPTASRRNCQEDPGGKNAAEVHNMTSIQCGGNRRRWLLQLEVVLLGVEGVALLVDEVEAFAIGVWEDKQAAVEAVGGLQVDVDVGAGDGIRTMGGVDEGGDVGALLIVGEVVLLHLAFVLAEETAGLEEGVRARRGVDDVEVIGQFVGHFLILLIDEDDEGETCFAWAAVTFNRSENEPVLGGGERRKRTSGTMIMTYIVGKSPDVFFLCQAVGTLLICCVVAEHKRLF